jgi:hypothetical protein
MKYWAYVNNEILGPYEKEKLLELPAFGAATLLCPQTPVGEKTEDWKEASAYPEVAALVPPAGPAAPAPATPVETAAPTPNPASLADQMRAAAGAPGSEPPKTEGAQPVFNAEIPDMGLKPISFHQIEQNPPATAPHIDGVEFEINKLISTRLPPKKDEPHETPRFSDAKYDPISISQIGKPAAQPANAAGSPETAPNSAGTQPAPSGPRAAEPVSPLSQASSPETPSVDSGSIGEIKSKLEMLAGVALTKQDIGPLREKLVHMEEILSSLKNDAFQREISDKIQRLENSVLEIKTSLAQASSSAANKSMAEQINFAGTLSPQAKGQPDRQAAVKENELGIKDEGSGRTRFKPAAAIKKFSRFLLTLVLLTGVLGVAAFLLRQMEVVDVTKFLPFRLPYLSPAAGDLNAPQAEEPAAQPGPQSDAQALPQGTQGTAEPAAEPAKRDVSPEIIYFTQKYSPKGNGSTLENKVIEDAVLKNGNVNKAVWQAKELGGGTFETSIAIPSLDGKSQLVYRYQIDYAQKTIKPLDPQSEKPLDYVLSGKSLSKSAEQRSTRIKKGGKNKTVSAKSAQRQAKPAKAKAPSAAADDEYEYVYEDETGGTEE